MKEVFLDLIKPEDLTGEYFMSESMVSAAEFWWNHLTYKQRTFIMDHVVDADILCANVPEHAYKTSGQWHKMEGWPQVNNVRVI